MSSRFLEDVPTMRIIERVVVIAVIVHNTFLFIYATFKMSRKREPKAGIEYLSIIVLFMIIASIVFAICHIFNIYPNSNVWCRYILKIVFSSFILTKLSTYYFFLESLFLIFNQKHEQTLMIISRISLILWGIIITILICISTGTQWDNTSNRCVTQSAKFLNWFLMFVISDIVISIIISILLSRRLIMVYTSNGSHYNLIKKYMILTLTAIITTQLSLLLFVSFGLAPLWYSIDMVINSWCILLTFEQNKVIYNEMCGNLHNLIGDKCILCYTCSCRKMQQEIQVNGNQTSNTNNTDGVVIVTDTKYHESTTTNLNDSSNVTSDNEKTATKLTQLQLKKGSITELNSNTLGHIAALQIECND